MTDLLTGTPEQPIGSPEWCSAILAALSHETERADLLQTAVHDRCAERDALAERVRVLEGARAELYRLGFEASGEGWNKEWPFEGVNLETSDDENAIYWRKKRDDDISPSPLVEGGR